MQSRVLHISMPNPLVSIFQCGMINTAVWHNFPIEWNALKYYYNKKIKLDYITDIFETI